MLPFEEITFREIRLMFTAPWPGPDIVIGIDPGQVHMGVTYLTPLGAVLHEITLPSSTSGIERILAATKAVQYLSAMYARPKAACLEGAAQMAFHGQVALTENRVSAAIALLSAGIWPVEIVPPIKVRAQVFGNGRFRSQEVWPELPENAASALGCAFYARKRLMDGKGE